MSLKPTKPKIPEGEWKPSDWMPLALIAVIIVYLFIRG